MGALARLPVQDHILWLNTFSALCGATAVYLCSRLTAKFVCNAIPEDVYRLRPGAAALAWLLGGLCAGTFLAFSTPFWIASTRALPQTLHLLGLLVAAVLLFNYIILPTNRRLLLLLFVYGIGCVEFTTFIVFAPFFGIYLLLFLWLRDMLSLRRFSLIAGAGLAGLSFYLAAAWLVTRTGGFYLREFDGFWHVLRVYMGGQYRFIVGGLPRHGWLLMLIVTFVPWIIGLLTVKRALGGDLDIAFNLLYLVLTGLTLLVLFNHTIAPWSLLGMRSLLVTPYLLSASLFGMLAATWILLPMYLTSNVQRGWKLQVRRYGAFVPAALSLAVVLWAPFRNLAAADGRPAALINMFAEHIVRSAADRQWLLTDGSLDHHITIAAHKLGKPLKTLNYTAFNDPVYRRYLSGYFDSLRLRGLLHVGMQPFLREWLERTPGIEKQVAVLAVPDLWYAADFIPVPRRLVFHGAREDELPDAAILWEEHLDFWNEITPVLQHYRSHGSRMSELAAAQFMRHTSLAANNLGVLLEDLERPDLAWQAYRRARTLDENNVSALLNLSVLAQRDGKLPETVAAETAGDMQKLEEALGEGRFRIRALAQVYGYVRLPHAFADMGWTWALSGNPGMAASGLRRALALSDDMPGARSALAAVYLAMDREAESRSVYREILERNPQDTNALLGLARIAMQHQRFEEAQRYIADAEAAGVPYDRILYERAIIDLLQGADDVAREKLEELADRQPEMTRAWILLAHIAMRQDDESALESIEQKISPLAEHENTAAFALGEISMMRGDFAKARRYFEQALELNPGNLHILEILLRRDMVEGRLDLAGQRMEKILAINPGHAFANYVLGAFQVRGNHFEMAEEAFRKSIEGQRTPYALKDLADVLVELGRAAEAEGYAREAVDLAPDSHQTWGTLGYVLLHLRRLSEAVNALEQALAFNINNVHAGIDLAEAFMHQGETEQALALVARLLHPDSPASARQRERLMSLQRVLLRMPANS